MRKTIKCEDCNGHGRLEVSSGHYTYDMTDCYVCRATGKVVADDCNTLWAKKHWSSKKKISERANSITRKTKALEDDIKYLRKRKVAAENEAVNIRERIRTAVNRLENHKKGLL